MRRPFAHLLVLSATIGAATLFSCKKSADSGVEKSIYYGRFIFERNPNVVGGVDTDLVKFTIEGRDYSFVLSTFNTTVCNSAGEANNFGGPSIFFIPDPVTQTNCDSLHIPRGSYVSRFAGDSLYLTHVDTPTGQRYFYDLKK